MDPSRIALEKSLRSLRMRTTSAPSYVLGTTSLQFLKSPTGPDLFTTNAVRNYYKFKVSEAFD